VFFSSFTLSFLRMSPLTVTPSGATMRSIEALRLYFAPTPVLIAIWPDLLVLLPPVRSPVPSLICLNPWRSPNLPTTIG
jgi:hypothetical protein